MTGPAHSPGMNVPALESVKRWLEAGAPEFALPGGEKIDGFHMVDFVRTHVDEPACGTTCCIAGKAAIDHWVDAGLVNIPNFGYAHVAQFVLGLTKGQADELFYVDHARNIGITYGDITPDWAAKVIGHLMDTGDVDWVKFKPASVVVEEEA